MSDELVRAVNLLCEYAKSHLPDGYEITISFRRDECSQNLHYEGEDIEVYSFGKSLFSDACEQAQDHSRHAFKMEFRESWE